MGEIFDLLFINPIFNVLLVLIFLFTSWSIPGSLGWAIISLTALFRLAFNPFYTKQSEMAMQMELVRPEIEALQKKYKDKPQKLQQEQMKLYKDKGINPAAGCLIAIVQLPVVFALYHVLLKFFETDMKDIGPFLEKIAYADFLKGLPIDPHFLGFNLSAAPSQYQEFGLFYLAIPLITAVLQYFQIVKTMPQRVDTKKDADTKGKKKSDEPEQESFQVMFQKQMKFMFPLMIGYFSYILPVGLALYWNIFSLFSILTKSPKQKFEASDVVSSTAAHP